MERKIEIGDFVKYRKYRLQVIEITDPYTWGSRTWFDNHNNKNHNNKSQL